jgi:nitrate reductase gamma subunit
MAALHLVVLLALVWAFLALVRLYAGVKGYGKRDLYARPAGDPAQGVRYAFTWAMAPWAKESVRMNLLSYLAGMAFHAGVGSGLVLLVLDLLGVALPTALLPAVRALTLAGAAGGFGLFMKRLFVPRLRGLSVLDDYLSNLLTSLFVLLAFDWTFRPELEALWLGEAVVLLAYLPLGKIRHCLFFFPTRYHLGAFFGRRGTFPPGGSFHA